ncbi:MAG: VOC family protein [Opitutales bacterium]
MHPTCLAHVCLRTADLGATERFYADLLGFPVIFRFTRRGAPYGFYLKVSETQFIEVFAEPRVESDNGHHELFHFCFETENLEALHAELAAAGFEPDAVKLGVDRTRQFWVTDPNGLRVELQEYTDRSLQLLGDGTQVIEVDW